MANIKSQKKRNLQNERRRVRNRSLRSGLKTAVKKVDAAADAGDGSVIQLSRQASRGLDKATSQGAIHKRTAARRKSRLARRVARAAGAGSA